MITGLLDLRMGDHIFNTNMEVFHTHILITKLRMVKPIGIIKMKGYQEHKQTNRNSKYYIVSTTGERKMMNGFRYIKELLFQNHNFDMYESYEKLKANNINVCAVKSAAIHIAQKDVRKAKKVLDFGCEIGDWRVESNKVNYISQRYSWRHMRYRRYRFINQKGKK